MVAWFQTHPDMETEEPQSVTVGGVQGQQFDTLTTDAQAQLFNLSGAYQLTLPEGEKNRVVVLKDVAGETVTIIFGGPAVDFEEFLPEVQKVLDTVEWEGA
jgi:hypothetical protein